MGLFQVDTLILHFPTGRELSDKNEKMKSRFQKYVTSPITLLNLIDDLKMSEENPQQMSSCICKNDISSYMKAIESSVPYKNDD